MRSKPPAVQQVTFVYKIHKDYSWNAEHSLKSCKIGQPFAAWLNKQPSYVGPERRQRTGVPKSWTPPNHGNPQSAKCRDRGESAKTTQTPGETPRTEQNTRCQVGEPLTFTHTAPGGHPGTPSSPRRVRDSSGTCSRQAGKPPAAAGSWEPAAGPSHLRASSPRLPPARSRDAPPQSAAGKPARRGAAPARSPRHRGSPRGAARSPRPRRGAPQPHLSRGSTQLVVRLPWSM